MRNLIGKTITTVAVATVTVGVFGAAPAQAYDDSSFCSRIVGTCWSGVVSSNASGNWIKIQGDSPTAAYVKLYDYNNGNLVGELVATGGYNETTIYGLYGRYRVRVDGNWGWYATGGLTNH